MITADDPILREIREVALREKSLRFIDYVRDREAGKAAAALANTYPRAKQFEAAYQEGLAQ